MSEARVLSGGQPNVVADLRDLADALSEAALSGAAPPAAFALVVIDTDGEVALAAAPGADRTRVAGLLAEGVVLALKPGQ